MRDLRRGQQAVSIAWIRVGASSGTSLAQRRLSSISCNIQPRLVYTCILGAGTRTLQTIIRWCPPCPTLQSTYTHRIPMPPSSRPDSFRSTSFWAPGTSCGRPCRCGRLAALYTSISVSLTMSRMYRTRKVFNASSYVPHDYRHLANRCLHNVYRFGRG